MGCWRYMYKEGGLLICRGGMNGPSGGKGRRGDNICIRPAVLIRARPSGPAEAEYIHVRLSSASASEQTVHYILSFS